MSSLNGAWSGVPGRFSGPRLSDSEIDSHVRSPAGGAREWFEARSALKDQAPTTGLPAPNRATKWTEKPSLTIRAEAERSTSESA